MALITPMIDNDREWWGFLRSIKVFVYEIEIRPESQKRTDFDMLLHQSPLMQRMWTNFYIMKHYERELVHSENNVQVLYCILLSTSALPV
jgi:hypothetical protein